jgi:hypothetical protein
MTLPEHHNKKVFVRIFRARAQATAGTRTRFAVESSTSKSTSRRTSTISLGTSTIFRQRIETTFAISSHIP